MHYLVCGGGPHFSGNLMQSYIRTCIIRYVVGAPILVETSCNHTFKHALFGMWWGPHFSGNLMQSYIRTCTIRCVVGAPIYSGNLMPYIQTCIIWCVVGAHSGNLAIIHANMHFRCPGGGPHFSGNFIQHYTFLIYIQTLLLNV